MEGTAAGRRGARVANERALAALRGAVVNSWRDKQTLTQNLQTLSYRSGKGRRAKNVFLLSFDTVSDQRVSISCNTVGMKTKFKPLSRMILYTVQKILNHGQATGKLRKTVASTSDKEIS
jgi:hypothetical protein